MTTYYFSTHEFELAYDVLNIQPNQVYKTDEKGLYHLLKSIIDRPEDFVDSEDGSCIFLDIDTDLKKIVEIAKEHLLSAGFDEPEDFRLPNTEPKEEKQTNGVIKFVNKSEPIPLDKSQLETEVKSLKHDWQMCDEVCDQKELKIRELNDILNKIRIKYSITDLQEFKNDPDLPFTIAVQKPTTDHYLKEKK